MSEPVLRSLGGRLPLLARDELDARQRRLFDAMTASAVPWAERSGFQARTAECRFIGPFNPALLHPELTEPFLALQAAEEAGSSLCPRVRQVVILTVGAIWNAPYVLYAHATVAQSVGLPDGVVEELVAGGRPAELDREEAAGHELARALTLCRVVDDKAYERAAEVLGPRGVLDVAMLTGIYHTVSAILGAFAIPAPSPAVAAPDAGAPRPLPSARSSPERWLTWACSKGCRSRPAQRGTSGWRAAGRVTWTFRSCGWITQSGGFRLRRFSGQARRPTSR